MIKENKYKISIKKYYQKQMQLILYMKMKMKIEARHMIDKI